MLTRSASKKKAISPVKSVGKCDDKGATFSYVVEDTKVNIQGFSISNDNGDVSQPVVNVNFSVVHDKMETENASQIVFNLGGIVINVPRIDSKTDGESNSRTNNNCKCSFSSPTSIEVGNAPIKQNLRSENSNDDSYNKFTPAGTSSVRKRKRSHVRQERAGKLDAQYDSESSLESCSPIRMNQDVLFHDETEDAEEYSFYKGVIVNGGYRRDTFAKKPVVRMVPISEEEIQAWSSRNSSSSTIVYEDSSKDQSSALEALDYKMVQRQKLLDILKRVDFSVSQQGGKKKEVAKEEGNGLDESKEPVRKECNKKGGISAKRKETGLEWCKRVFGDFRGKFPGSSETDEGFNEEETDWLAKYIGDQDSIQTEIFDGESDENEMTVLHKRQMPTLVEELIQRLESPEVDDDVMAPDAEGGSSGERTTPKRDEELPAKSNIREGSSEKERREEHPKRNRSSRGRKKNVSVGSATNDKGNETVIGVGAIRERQIQYKDRENLLSIQLECIKQEILSRETEVKSSSDKKTVRSARKSKIHEKDDVSGFALGTRRSLRCVEVTEPKSGTRTRGTPRKSLEELYDNNVTTTPKSTRAKSLRMEVTDSMESKKRKLGDTPKTGKTPKKLAAAESSVTDGEEVALPSSKSMRCRKPMKEDKTGSNEAMEKETQSTPRTRGSRRKTSQLDEKGDNGKEVKSSPASRKSVSPVKQQTEREEATESGEKAMEDVSSPLKKKKQAAERLRAEEEWLGQRQMRERELMVTSSANKSKSPVTQRTVEEVTARVETPSTPKKKSPNPGKSPGGRQILVEESLNIEADSPSKRQTAELPEEDENASEESEVVAMPSPKRGISPKKQQKTQESDELESKMEAVAPSSPRRQKSKSPQKRRVEEPEAVEHSEPEEVTLNGAPSPKEKQKSVSPQKKYADEIEPKENESETAENCVVSSPKRESSKSRGKNRVEGLEPEEIDAEISVSSPARQKSVTPKNHQDQQQGETEESVSERFMCHVSPHKQEMMNKPRRQQDVELFLIDNSDSEGTVLLPSPKPRKGRSSKEALGPTGSESEVVEKVVMSPIRRQESRSPKKRVEEEVGDNKSDGGEMCAVLSPKGKKSKSPGKNRVEERQLEEIEANDEVMPASAPKQQKSKSPKKRHVELDMEESESEDVDESVVSPKQQKSKSPKKRHVELEMEESESEFLDSYVKLPKRQKKKKSKRKHIEEREEEAEAEGGEEEEEEEESEDEAAASSPMQERRKQPQKRHAKEQEKDDSGEDASGMPSSKMQKIKSPRKNLTEEERETDVNVSNNVETDSASQRKRKRKKSTGGLNEEGERVEDAASQLSEPMSKKDKSKKKEKRKQQEDVEMTIPKLGEDFLESISSRKTSVRVRDAIDDSEERTKKRKKRKNKLLKSFLAEEGYIPLSVGGATKFGVVGLDKFKAPPRHPAFDLKRDLLYGSRVKRIPYSQVQAYKMKVESRATMF